MLIFVFRAYFKQESDKMNISIVPVVTMFNVSDSNLPVPPTWAMWSSELLKTKKSTDLTPPLSKKTNKKINIKKSKKKYSEEKVRLVTQQKNFFENEERRPQERHKWAQIEHELKILKLKHEIDEMKKD